MTIVGFSTFGLGRKGPQEADGREVFTEDEEWKVLKEAKLTALSNKDCKEMFRGTPYIQAILPDKICATSQTASTCKGDSGGNILLIRYVIHQN